MKKWIRSLFLVADLLVVISLVLGGVILARFFFLAMDVMFSSIDTNGSDPGPVLGSLALILVTALVTAIGMFGYVLLLKRQIFGLIIVGVLAVMGLFVPVGQLKFYIVVSALQLFVLGLPWTLMYFDMKKRGTLSP